LLGSPQPGVEHLVLVSSLPTYVPGGLHDLQVWNEALCNGAWGRHFVRVGERMRRSLDLEDWPAFSHSFSRLTELLVAIATDAHAPSTICLIAGDIHFSYVAPIALDQRQHVKSKVHQIAISPIRNVLVPRDRRVLRFGVSRIGRFIARLLRRTARGPETGATWHSGEGPIFDNALGSLRFDRNAASLLIERAKASDDGTAVLETIVDISL